MRKFDYDELNALNNSISHNYPTQYHQLGGRILDEIADGILVIRYSNCRTNHQFLGSNLTLIREIGTATSRL